MRTSARDTAVRRAESAFAYQCRIDGLTLDETQIRMAGQFEKKFSVGTVVNRIKEGMSNRIDPLIDEYRKLATDRAEERIARIRGQMQKLADKPILDEDGTVAMDYSADLEVLLLKAEDHLAKIQGTFAPVRQEVAVIPGGVDAEIAALAEQLGFTAAGGAPRTPVDAGGRPPGPAPVDA